ncbi:MAG: hypothetical protein H7333_08545 [Bdellovibrionales bacterium]|nr:hypothetical protein [Oligoflexia bacterium]
MKNLITALSLFTICLSSSAFAGEEPLVVPAPFIAVSSDAKPGEVYHLGYLINTTHDIVGVYYENPYATNPKEKIKSFTLAEIQKGAVLVQKEDGNKIYELVRGKAALQTDNTVIFTLDYLRNAIFGSRESVKLGVRFNAQSSSFEAFHLTSKKTITGAKIVVNYAGSQPVGVDKVLFQYAKLRKTQRLRSLRMH